MANHSEDNYILKFVEIEGLWGRPETLHWDLNPDVNILVGENGTGKSTLLKLMAAALSPKFPLKKKIAFQKFEVFRKAGNGNTFASWDFDPDKGSKWGPYPPDLEIDFIDTFEGLQTDKNDPLKSGLDHALERTTRKYLAWQSNQSNLVFSKKMDFEQAFERKTYLISTLNRLFAPTLKMVNVDESDLEFLWNEDERITCSQLSSGEKQLLVLMLTTLCQADKPAILLLDEPEISLHLRWQHELVGILRRLNPNCQLIIATHSPSIFNDGYRDRVFFMEDLWQKEQTPQPA